MKSIRAITLGLLLVMGLTVMGCSSEMFSRGDTGWITLLDGSNPKTLDNWNRIGDANWRAEDGAIVADKGKGGHLVSKNSYKDLQIRAEFWADHSTNSGIFFRISDPIWISIWVIDGGDYVSYLCLCTAMVGSKKSRTAW